MHITPKQYALLLLDLDHQKLDSDELTKRICDISGLFLKNKDISKISRVEQIYLTLKGRFKQELDVDIKSAEYLTDNEIDILKTKISKKYSVDKKKLNISVTLDSALKGGFVVKIGNEIVDTSIEAKLSKLKNALL
ncbi:MAG: F0F1 ATP synthase subunit delta [Patescibacteria group bacterium]|nr:F0F1 ATP synthase subunit delta [Patescibacteria group bacterium]